MRNRVVVLCTIFTMCAWGEDSSIAETDSAVEIDDIKEQFLLAERYANGNGIETNMQEAAKWYRKAAERGHVKAQYELGLCYANGNGVEKNEAEAKKWFSSAAARGYSKAKNRMQAEQYRQRAEHGDAIAQYELAMCYANGRGVVKDVSEAGKWYRKSAEQGHFIAQFQLGLMYYNGEGIETNKLEAMKWYRKAAEQGHIYAQFQLGLMYYNGEGVEPNMLEAMKWYRKAAEQGHVKARARLDLMSQKGKQEAAKWFRKAAEKGHEGAQFQLGVMYDKGDGVETNKWMAMMLLNTACMQGYEPAKQFLQKNPSLRVSPTIVTEYVVKERKRRESETRSWILAIIGSCCIFKFLWASAKKRKGIRSLGLRVLAVLGVLLCFFIHGFLSYKSEQYEKARKDELIGKSLEERARLLKEAVNKANEEILNSGEHGHKEHDEQ